MRFLRADEVETSDADVVFRESSWNKALAVIFCWGVAGACLYIAAAQRVWLMWVIAAFMFLIGWAFFGLWRKTRLASNWIVRIPASGGTMLIKYRSYANPHLPAEDLIAMELAAEEVEWVGIEGVTYIKPKQYHGVEKEKNTFLELRVSERIVAEVASKLAEERRREAPPRGLFKSTSKSLHYPVTADGRVIRVKFRGGNTYVTPGVRRAVEVISQGLGVTVAGMGKSMVDLAKVNAEEAEGMIRTLAETGDVIAAIELARRVYGCSLAEAKKLVEDLVGK